VSKRRLSDYGLPNKRFMSDLSFADRQDMTVRLDLDLEYELIEQQVPGFRTVKQIRKSGNKIIIEVPTNISQSTVQNYFNIITGLVPQLSDDEISQLVILNDYYYNNKIGQPSSFPTRLSSYLRHTEYIYRHTSDAYYTIYLSKYPQIYNVVMRDLNLKFSGSDRMPIYPLTVNNIPVQQLFQNSHTNEHRSCDSLVFKGKQKLNDYNNSYSTQFVVNNGDISGMSNDTSYSLPQVMPFVPQTISRITDNEMGNDMDNNMDNNFESGMNNSQNSGMNHGAITLVESLGGPYLSVEYNTESKKPRNYCDYGSLNINTLNIPLFFHDLTSHEDIVVAGGCVVDMLKGRYYNDIDVFVVNTQLLDTKVCLDKAVFSVLVVLAKYIKLIKRLSVTATQNVIQIEFTITGKAATNSIFYNNQSYQLHNRGYDSKIKLQIIKRVYRSLPEIFVGFDINASCIAYANHVHGDFNPIITGINTSDNNKCKIYTCDRWLLAVKYGINVVCPFRQSQTYSYRLNKYMKKGFVPMLPDAIHMKNGKLASTVWSGDYVKHHVSELLVFQSQNPIEFHKDVSDYTHMTYEIVKAKNLLLPEVLERAHKFNIQPISELYWKYNNDGHLPSYHAIIGRDLLLDMLRNYGPRYMEQIGDMYTVDDKRYVLPTWEDPNVIMDILVVSGHLSNWLVTDPNTQITSSFHPTNYDFLST